MRAAIVQKERGVTRMANDGLRVMTFIDGSNLYHSLKGVFKRTDLNFEKLTAKLADGRRLVRSYYYNAAVDQTKEASRYKEQQKFFQMIKSLDYFELRLGRLVYQNWPTVSPYEKGIDVQLGVDMLVHAVKNNYDVAVLVSGDTDFAGALQAVKDVGKNVEVALFGKGSYALRDVADRVVALDTDFLKNCWK